MVVVGSRGEGKGVFGRGEMGIEDAMAVGTGIEYGMAVGIGVEYGMAVGIGKVMVVGEEFFRSFMMVC